MNLSSLFGQKNDSKIIQRNKQIALDFVCCGKKSVYVSRVYSSTIIFIRLIEPFFSSFIALRDAYIFSYQHANLGIVSLCVCVRVRLYCRVCQNVYRISIFCSKLHHFIVFFEQTKETHSDVSNNNYFD